MSWTFGNWQDFLKKKACRYILQHYLGQFLKQKLSLDQLSLDLYNGTGTITELNLDVQVYSMTNSFSMRLSMIVILYYVLHTIHTFKFGHDFVCKQRDRLRDADIW